MKNTTAYGNQPEEIAEAKIPAYALPFLEYADDSGLEQDDLALIQEWLDQFVDHINLTYEYERNDHGEIEVDFTPYPAFGLATDTVTASVWGHRVQGGPQ
jgi:hypothetical protein